MSSRIPSTSSLARVENISCTNEAIHLSNLRSKGNSFFPVFSLPSELLEAIFIHGARDYYYGRNGPYLTYRIPTWVNVSYVCRHWRDVALNCPTLWTYHFNLSLYWSRELMIRSRCAPFKVSFTVLFRQAFWFSRLLRSLQGHSWWIQELRLRISPSCLPRRGFFLVAPRLEILEINPTGVLHERLVITGAPVLRTIKLVSCTLQWQLLDLSRLETLSISMYHGSTPREFDFAEILTVLRNVQNLTALYLDNVIPGGIMFNGNHHKIKLPRLALLDVRALLPAVVFLFSCIEIPVKTQINLCLSLEHDTPARDYAPISSFLSQRFRTSKQTPSSAPIVRSLIMCLGSHTSLTLSSSEWDCHAPPRFHEGELNSTVLLQITFGISLGEMGEAQRHPVLTDICRSLPLTNVQTLSVQGDGLFPWKFRFWRELFGCISDLRYLKLERGYLPDLSMLSLKPEANSDGRPAQDQDPSLVRTLVPALEKVELDQIHFLPNDITAHPNGMSEKSFFDVLFTRNILRDQVMMDKCGVSKWDGLEL